MLVRLHKYLADNGVASRRKCEEHITQGLIKVNGVVVKELGTKVDTEKDKVEVAPHLKMRQQNFAYYAFHKPVGYVTTISGQETPKITELLQDIPERIFPVGRLDKLTSGLLLLTNDGRFAYEMTHPKFEHEKEYIVKVREKVTPELLRKLNERFFIRGRKIQQPKIILQGPHLFRVILHEGRNRQIRRMCERATLHIEKLKRIRIQKLLLGNLEVGTYRKLTQEESEPLFNPAVKNSRE